MGKITIFIFFLISQIFYGQEITFYSPFTQHEGATLIETINRKIVVSDEVFTIITDTPDGKDIYTLTILSVEQRVDDGVPNTVFHCETKDRIYPTVIVYYENDGAPYMDVFQPSFVDPKKLDRFRFLID